MTNEEADAHLLAYAKIIQADFGLTAPLIVGASAEDGGFHVVCRLSGAQLSMLAFDLVSRALALVKPEHRDAPEVLALSRAASLLQSVADVEIASRPMLEN